MERIDLSIIRKGETWVLNTIDDTYHVYWNKDLEKNFINDSDLEKSLEEKEMNDCIINNLKSLGETEYKVFTKFYFEDKKIKDIAKECGISTNNAKVTLHRTRKKVREFLKIGGFY